jgi:hypothetical protein
MRHLLRCRPSAAMVVAIVALVVAASGTAVAASKLVSGNSLIKKNSLSGNRLQNRTVTGSKIKLSSLGTVPSAKSASTATTAANANELGGQAATAFAPAAITTGLVTADEGQTVALATVGPITLSEKCFDNGGFPDVQILATSTAPNSIAADTVLTGGQTIILDNGGFTTDYNPESFGGTSFIAPGPLTWIGSLYYATDQPGTGTTCVALAHVSKG